MPFKIPRPTFDEDLVLEIEDHLHQDAMTEIVDRYPVVDSYGAPVGMEGHRVRGKHHPDGRRDNNYARPMIQLIENGASSASMLRPVIDPCHHCLDIAYTRNCPEHGDPGKRKTKTKRVVDAPRRPDVTLYVDEGHRPLYDRMIEMFARELPGWGTTPTWESNERATAHVDPPVPNLGFQLGDLVRNTPIPPVPESVRRIVRDNIEPSTLTMDGYLRAVASQELQAYTRTPPIRNGNGTFVVHVEADTVAGDRGFSFEVEPSGE